MEKVLEETSGKDTPAVVQLPSVRISSLARISARNDFHEVYSRPVTIVMTEFGDFSSHPVAFSNALSKC